jgi:SNF2 family DNA or RNA helicase
MYEHIVANPFSALFVDMGMGKSVTTLTAIVEILFDRLECDKVLVIAPKRVAQTTWKEEIDKWEHLKNLRISVIDGNEQRRIKRLNTAADVYTISRENVAWLVKYYGRKWPFKTVIVDESSSFKNPASKRFKALKRVRPLMKRVVLLTGTPAPNSLIDLWSQLYLIDRGERLGQSVTAYRQHYFRAAGQNGHVVYNWKLRKGAEKAIYDLISDVCISMKSEDYLTLPGRLDQNVTIHMPDDLAEQYEELKKELILTLDTDVITAANAAGILNKLSQFANGAAYIATDDKSKVWRHIHDLKIEAVREDLEALQGRPFLLFYQFKHDKERLLKEFADYGARELRTPEDIAAWNRGEIKLLITHPASAGHGLNLQAGGYSMGWFGLTWDLELYQQAVKRLDRQGQTDVVINRRYLVKGTVDFLQLIRLGEKGETQNFLLDAVKAMVKEYRKAA